MKMVTMAALNRNNEEKVSSGPQASSPGPARVRAAHQAAEQAWASEIDRDG